MNASRLKRTESGVALVVTLILLAMIAFMAIAFLVLTRGERSSVTTVADQTIAKLASDTGLERAKMELLAPMMAFRDPHRYDLMVSTNYVNPLGFDPSLPDGRLTNVSYVYQNGTPVSPADHARNLLNLYYYPRVPVYVNVNGTNSDFRYYLDLNRNGRYDTNGLLAVMSGDPGFPYFNTNGVLIAQPFAGSTASNFFVGDPEWIGQLERPGYPHSPSNRFVARYAYIAIPAGKTLDINTVHNYARVGAPQNMQFDHFLRNQGVGPWEINLASFFVDLNTNRWPYLEPTDLSGYNYVTGGDIDITRENRGTAFDIALSILQYRYRGLYSLVNMRSVEQLFGRPGENAFRFDFVDGYSSGPLMTNTWWPSRPNDADQARLARPWAGDQSPRMVFNHQELFDANSFPKLAEALRLAGAGDSSYDRYTFYRMLAQMGTDSSTDSSDQMNLNYDNLITRNPQGRTSATNFVSWSSVDGHTGLAFFTNAATRLFASSGYNFNITNIQVYPTNYYTPSVHRLLQLAANMYDATTTRFVGTNQLPTVFRPVLTYGVGGGDNVYITGYAPVTDASVVINNFDRLKDLTLPEDRRTIGPNDLAYGVPLVIGVKKGLPNFNEFAGQTAVQVTRKLEFRRNVNGDVAETNQMYVVTITNNFGLEAWNSYSNSYTRPLRLMVQAEVFGVMTNDRNNTVLDTVHRTAVIDTNYAARTWAGFVNLNYASYSFRVPIDPKTNSFYLLTNSTYVNATKLLKPLTGIFERNSGFPDLSLYLNLRTRFKFALIDQQTSRLVDFVTIDSVEDTLDISRVISSDSAYTRNRYAPNANPGSLWATNRSKNDIQTPTFGILNQIAVGMGSVENMNEAQWRNFIQNAPYAEPREDAQRRFNDAMLKADTTGAQVFYAPFDPIRTIYYNTVWQANDPLVHYTVGDLMLPRTNRYELDVTLNSPINNIRAINPRYEPWTLQTASQSSSPTRFDWGVKDPLITRSDDWDFPTNKFPNVGWLGRVHRGTPWQTVYLKSPPTDLKKWQEWTRNLLDPVNYGQVDTNRWAYNTNYSDAELSRPDRDRELFDLFTTSFSESASRGKMSINQTNLPAWSAMLSGVLVMTNAVTDNQLNDDPLLRPTNSWMVVQPAGIYDQTLAPAEWPQVARIVRGINATRATTNFNGSFKHLGDILAVPQLTVESPFLNKGSLQKERALDDAAVERIPQQILGLLKVESAPRFVIYSYGQSLKPANNGVMVSGPYFNLCTNYQVTAEVATKTVVRVEGVPNKPRVIVESYNPLPPD
jgi:hypothetical protein